MIAYVKGVLFEKEPTRVVVEAAGVGYEVLIPISTFDRLPKTGDTVKLLTNHCVREDDEILFGFATEAEKEMFGKLTSVSGVGPKIALAILSGSSIAELSLAIASGNAKRISAIKGVGKKTAEKICVELKDKVSMLDAKSLATGVGSGGQDKSFVRGPETGNRGPSGQAEGIGGTGVSAGKDVCLRGWTFQAVQGIVVSQCSERFDPKE